MANKIHAEIIECPNCGINQAANVEHSLPWWTYVHECIHCNYTIMESEWNELTIDEIKKSFSNRIN